MIITRRNLLMTGAKTGMSVVVVASAQAKPDEKDPQTVARGYVDDANARKFPNSAWTKKG